MKITKKLIEDMVREMIIEEITPKQAIEKEGGAIGLDMLADMTGMSKDELRDLINKDADIEKHDDGDIVDTSGLKEEETEKDDLTGTDKNVLKTMSKKLKGASKLHAAQADQLDNIINDAIMDEIKNTNRKTRYNIFTHFANKGLDFDKLNKIVDKGLKADGGVYRHNRD